MLLVTGITGHTGKYFLKELVDNNYEGPIRCLVRKSSDTSLLDKSGLRIEKVFGDLNNEKFIKQSMNGVDIVMHIYNIHHSSMVVEAAIDNKVKRAILVHTTGVYSNFKQASLKYKNVEKEVLGFSESPDCPTQITILRPTMIYGDMCDSNMSKFIKMIDKLKIMPVINGGNSLIQPVNARDLGKAFYKVLLSPEETDGKTYNLSGEKPIQLIEVFKLISHNLNKKTFFISIPLIVGVFFAKLLKLLSLGRFDYIEKVQRMAENRSYSHEEATRDFNYHPMSFTEGIQIEVEQYLEKSERK